MKKILCAAVLAALAGAASAQGYAGALIGMSRYDIDCEGASCDKGDSTGKIYGGYTVSPGLSVEVGYINFGEFSADGSGTALKLKSTAFLVGGAFRSELSPDWAATLRLGLSRVKTKAEATRGALAGNRSDTNVGIYAGLGVEYAITSTVKLVGAWDFTRFEVGDESGSVHNFGVGAQVGF